MVRAPARTEEALSLKWRTRGWPARGASLALLVGAIGAAPAGQERARQLARQSIREYEVGSFERALADVAKAYELSGLPELLFNLGQCHRALAQWKEAEFSYRNFLRRRPDAKNRVQVLALIEEMHARQQPAPLPPPAGLPPPQPTTPAALAPPVPSAPAAVVAPVAPIAAAPVVEAEKSSAGRGLKGGPPLAERAEPATAGRSRVLSLTLFTAAAVGAGLAGYGASRVVGYETLLSTMAMPASYPQYQSAAANAAARQANTAHWQDATIVLGVTAVAALVGGLFTW